MSPSIGVVRIVRRFPVATAVLTTTLLLAILGVARRIDALPEGLDATYFRSLQRSTEGALRTIDHPSTESIGATWQHQPLPAFAATWRGFLFVGRDGLYTFATVSDDGSSLDIDGVRIVENGGPHPSQRRDGSVQLARGVHEIAIDYTQEGGDFHLEVLWARDGGPLSPIPAWALSPRHAGYTRFLASVALKRSLVVLEWFWVTTLVLAGSLGLWRGWRAIRRRISQRGDWPVLRWILLGSLLLNLIGIWWGLPAEWVQIELTPSLVLDGVRQHFSHGWFDFYPPFQFFVLAAVMSPVLLLQALGRMTLDGQTTHTMLVLAFRLVSVAAGAGTVIAAYHCGGRIFSRRAGLFAASIVALVAPFVHYAKTANVDVPYLFWFAVSLVFFLRLIERLALRDFLLFAVTATLAVCTKDQAYGLYLLMPLGIVHRLWRVRRDAGEAHPFWRALMDRRLILAAVTSAALFALIHNLLFNFGGFWAHVSLLMGSGSQDYRVFEPTLAGRVALLRLTGDLIARSLGWPMVVVTVGGVVLATTSAAARRWVILLALPVVSYYFGLINVILYNYDRFVMPICFVLALFGGLALDRFVTAGSGRRFWRTATVSGVFIYTLLYSGAVDVLMIGDSRYWVQRWLADHAKRGDLIGTCFDLQYLPNVDAYPHLDLCSIDALQTHRPAFFVINADYARAVPAESQSGQLLAGLKNHSLGYRLVVRRRERAPWPWLPGAHPDLVGPRHETVVFSTLRNINPTIEVFEREPR
jgi:PA14 domain-containing protein/dolichyl-phosphate-mannose-protein mannosyltransferase